MTIHKNLPAYAELHAISNFSFLRGASHPEELVARAKQLGYSAFALTDECSVAGVVRAHLAAREYGLKLIIGAEFTLGDGTRFIMLAPDRAAYGDLSELITCGRRNATKGTYRLSRADVAQYAHRCLALWLPDAEMQAAHLDWLREIFAQRLWIAVELLLSGYDTERLEQLRTLGMRAGIPLVAAGDVQMHKRERKRLHDVVTAIRLGTTVQTAGHALAPNGERCLRSRATLARLYPHELLEETLRVAERCTFTLEELRYEYPEELVPPGETPASHLRKLTEEGVRRRWPEGPAPKVRDLIERELALIAELSYEPFFLTVYDVVRYARSRNILCQGRGSAANSAVCFCLGITEVDPARIQVLFERFLSKERNEPPDIDVDFEHERREEVIQYVYAKYGRRRAALAATVITYRTRSAVRDVGKALGFALEQVDSLAKNFQWWDGGDQIDRASAPTPPPPQGGEAGFSRTHLTCVRAAERARMILSRPGGNKGRGWVSRGISLEPKRNPPPPAVHQSEPLREEDARLLLSAGFDPANRHIVRFVELVRAILGFPRHLSQHVGGFVIARDRLSRLVPIENAAMPERTVIQWDKDDLDALGLLKVDCLGLGMLTAIHKAFDLIERFDGRRLTCATVPAEDPRVYEMICHADTIGVFQIESRAQMAMLPRLRPVCFYDLVIEIAIVRPGPIQGNMVHPYLRRRQKQEPVSYPSDEVRAVLERTLGVPIFQEQVIKLAMVAAGFTPGEADGLRRSIAGWRRHGGLDAYEHRLVSGMRARGYPEAYARQIFQQILGFGEYGFPESHAASFALLAYVSAWLKCHEPAAFLAALLNSQPMGFYAPAQLVQDARRHGVEVRPVDVCSSVWDCTLERDAHGAAAARLGLRQVKGLTQAGAERLVAARANASFDDVDDLARRVKLARRDLDALAAAGALHSITGHRHRARWAVAGIEPSRPLLAQTSIPEALPLLRAPTEGENLVADYAHLGLTLGRHPLALLRRHLAARHCISAAEVHATHHGQHTRTAGVVICRQHPSSANGVIFLTLEDETGNTNIIVWQSLAEQERRALSQARLLVVDGEVQREGEVLHVIARRLEDHSSLLGALLTRSRDFQ